MLAIIIKIFVAIITATVCFYYGRNVPFKEQLAIYDALRSTSAIIFGVMGAWIAILYPGALNKLFSKNTNADKDIEYNRIKSLMSPMVYSAVIIAIILFAAVGGPIVKQIDYLKNYIKIVRGISYSIVGVLTIMQLIALILALVPGHMIQYDIERFRKKEDLLSRLQSRIKKQ